MEEETSGGPNTQMWNPSSFVRPRVKEKSVSIEITNRRWHSGTDLFTDWPSRANRVGTVNSKERL